MKQARQGLCAGEQVPSMSPLLDDCHIAMKPCGAPRLHYRAEDKRRDIQLEMLVPDEKELFLFGGRKDGVSTLFTENKELPRKLALFHS